MKQVIIAMLLGLSVPAVVSAQAAKKAEAAAPEENLTVITSDKLTFENLKHYAIFEDNVVVVDPGMRILANKMTVLFDDNNKVKTIRAEGQVYIIQEDKKARADLAVYNVETQVIVLTGTPQVTQGPNVLTGDVITFFRAEGRMTVEPRSKLVIFPKDGKGGTIDPFFGK